jgi:two-component system sensor histidine kinase and response regulator WspE
LVDRAPPDPVLVDLFRSELEEHAAKLVKACDSGLDDISPEVAAELAAAAYSIESAARILSFESLAQLAASIKESLEHDPAHAPTAQEGALRDAAKALNELAAAAPAAMSAAIETNDDRFRLLTRALNHARDGGEHAPPSAAENSVKDQPRGQAARNATLDTPLLEMFVVELQTHVRVLEQGLVRTEGNASPDLLESLMRAAHSIKGAARMVALDTAVKLAHAMEDLLTAAQRRELALTPPRIDGLLQASDFFLRLSASPPSAIAEQLETDSAAASAIISCLDQLRDPALDAAAVPLPAVSSHTRPELTTSTASADRVVRILAENLSKLTGLSGECLIEVQSAAPLRADLVRIGREQTSAGSALQSALRALAEGAPENARDSLQTASRTLETVEKLTAAQTENFNRLIARLELIVDSLHREAIASRMCTFSEGVAGFPRMVHELARSLKKSVRLDIRGESTRVDRDILAHLEAPLTHLLRNSVDHGIEPPDVRERAGKSAHGLLVLEARQVAGALEVVVSDDGAGVDLDRIRKNIVDRGYAAAEMARSLAEPELLEFLFLPGFSTAPVLSDISGRGVGLDVVQTTLHDIGGSIRIENQPASGCTFRMKLPLTLAVLRCLVVEIAGEPYAFPLTQVEAVHVIHESDIEQIESSRFYQHEGEALALVEAATVLRCKSRPQTSQDHLTVVIIGAAPARYGLVVDAMLGHRDLVVIPLDRRLSKIPNVSAAAILEDSRTVLFLDSKDMVESIKRMLSDSEWKTPSVAEARVGPPHASKKILVVDDSMTVRQLQRRILTNQGYEVVLAVDGMDGWNTIQSEPFDLVITDVDMPRLNGIDLVRKIKTSWHTADIPVMIVSYKNEEDYRQQGLEAGASYYLSKTSFHDDRLLSAVIDLIGEATHG